MVITDTIELFVKGALARKELNNKKLVSEHMLYAFLKEKEVSEYLKINGIKCDSIVRSLKKYLNGLPKGEPEEINDELDRIHAILSVVDSCILEIGCDDIESKILVVLSAYLLDANSIACKTLEKYNVNLDFTMGIYQKKLTEKVIDKYKDPFSKNSEDKFSINPFKTDNNDVSPINKYTINLTEKVNSKDWIEIVGREKEIDLLEQIILRHDKPNAILVGNPGIGKTKIVEGFAKRVKDVTVYQLDSLAFMSNIMFKGEIEKRVKDLTSALMEKENVILYIDEIHTICTGGDSQALDIASLLKPIMTSNSLKIIGSTTFEEYRKYIERDEAFTRRFYKMVIEEPSYNETLTILKNIKKEYEKYFGLVFSQESLDEMMNLTNKFVFDKHYPDKAIDLLDMTGAYVKHDNRDFATVGDVRKVISKMRNIPLSNISQSEEDIYKHLEDRLKEKIFGQDEAVEALANAVIISRSGLRETSKTAISLMLKGASSVGKTECCKQLAEIMSIPLIRFDMSEYMEEHSVSKLIGSPPGYKDSGNGKAGNGLLINAIDENPHCVLLLDEIEKANSKIHNLLLQVMDNGKLTSSMGKQVSFENVFLIMTSNTGSYNAHKRGIGFGNSSDTPSDEDYETSFLPEFRNRIDKTITFNNLDNNVMIKVCKKFLNELKEILIEKNITLDYDESIVNYLVEKASVKDNGAREIKHIITNEIKNVIAKNLVFGYYKNKDVIKLSYDNKIKFGE